MQRLEVSGALALKGLVSASDGTDWGANGDFYR
jgi:hypothetical protein